MLLRVVGGPNVVVVVVVVVVPLYVKLLIWYLLVQKLSLFFTNAVSANTRTHAHA